MSGPLRIAVPSPTSRLHSVVTEAVGPALQAAGGTPHAMSPVSRTLVERLESGDTLVHCRGTDVPVLIARGFADLGFTGYDMAVEAALSTGRALDMRSLAPARPSYVCYATVPGRTPVRRLYTEYPATAGRWARATRGLRDAEVVELHGSLEGVVRSDPEAAAFVLVTTGETLDANGLLDRTPILATDLCLVRREHEPAEWDGLPAADLPVLPMPRFCQEAAA